MKTSTKNRSHHLRVPSPRTLASTDTVKGFFASWRIPGKALLVALCLLSVARIEAATVTWDAGEAPVTDWMTATFSNWSGDTTPAGQDVVFNSTGAGTNSTNATSIVNSNVSISSLAYSNNITTNWHVTEIQSGNTLTVGGTANVLRVGAYSNTSQNITRVAIQGEGALSISESGGSVFIGNFRTNTLGTGTNDSTHSAVFLDMHDLASFSANLGASGNVYIGTPTNVTGNLGGYAVVSLAQTSAITANNLYIGSSLANVNSARPEQTPTSLSLGKTNTINADNIWIGSGAANSLLNGKMNFVAADSSAKIRAADGSGRVTSFYVGVKNLGGTTGGVKGVADFSGSAVDLLVNEMIVGQGASQNSNLAEGTFIMDEGTVDTTTLVLGKGYNTYSTGTTTTGTLTINGGEFIAGSISSGEGYNANATSAAGSVNGIINVADDGTLKTGTLKMATSLRDNASNVGAITSVLNISNTATVQITNGGITMGKVAGTSDKAALSATINLYGGSLTVGGNIAEGVVSGQTTNPTSTINLDGGSLDMQSHNISVDNFNAKSGTLQNVGEFNAGADLVKTTAGTLTIAGTNTYSGSTIVSNGTLIGTATSVPGNIVNEGVVIFNQAGNGAYSNVLSGSGTFKKDGAGTATFSGSSANTLSGDVTVSNGTLELAKTAGVASIAGDLTINSGAKLLVSTSNQVADTSNVTLSGGTIERASGVSEVFGDLNLTDDSFLDYGSGIKGTLTFGTYTPSSLLTVNNFFYGNMLVFSTDLSSTINDTDFFSFSSEFEYDWDGGASTFTITAVPEPSAYVAVVSLIGLMIWSLRRRTKCAR